MIDRRVSAGFTLIEMLVLIIIMAILSTVVVPAYSRLRDRADFETQLSKVQGFFAEARARAIELGADVEVRYDTQSETFVASAPATLSTNDVPTAIAEEPDTLPVAYQATLALPRDYRIMDVDIFGPEVGMHARDNRADSVLYFHEDGTSDGMRCTVSRDTGAAATVTIWPSTATVDIEPISTRR